MKAAIEVSKISKSYRITHEQKANYKSLRDDIAALFLSPVSLVTGRRLKTEEFWALKDASFKVDHGEVVGIIGRNGSGKSTLLKILSRITEPTSGQAIMRGRVASLLEVGTGFHPELTGRENIYFNGSILGMTKREINQKFDEIIAFAEIEKFLDTPVKFYSSGMYVRLAFAVAAHLEPDILIVDEVLAVGDAAFQRKCLGKMRTVAGEGRTVLFVSHSMESIKQLCSRVVLLENGQVKADGSVTKVTNEYIGRYGGAKPVYEFEPSPKRLADLRKIVISNSRGQKTSELSAGEDWSIDINYDIKEELKRTLLTVEILSDTYEVLYETSDSDGLKEIPVRRVGNYNARLNLDQFHLGPGNYLIHIALHTPGKLLIHEANDLPITVSPDQNDIRGTYFGGQYHGFIGDRAVWSTKKQ